MLPHRIRLRGPWQLIPLHRANGSAERLPAPIVAQLPALWSDCGLGDFVGRVRHIRRFGLPRSIDSFERVWLSVAGPHDQTEIWLNDEWLGAWPKSAALIELEITHRLRDRNELRIEIASGLPGGGLNGEVALEIRGQAWLSDLAAKISDGTLTIRGTANGQADRPLDLYAIMGRFGVIQKRIEASPLGKPFEFASDPILPEQAESAVRIELVDGSNVWHAADVPVVSE